MLNQLAYMLGGRAAEELVFHDPTTGASNDIEKATAVARAMVTQYGMTERLGAIRYGKENGEVFLGRDMGHTRDYSEEIAAAIDEEVRSLIDHAHNEAFEILVDNRDVLDKLVIELLEKETLNKEQVAAIFTELRLRPSRPAWTGSERRAPSDRPPVDVPERIGDPVGVGGSMLGAYGLPAPGGTYALAPGSYVGPPAPDGTYPNPVPIGTQGAPNPTPGAPTGWDTPPGSPGPSGSNGGQSHAPGAAHPSGIGHPGVHPAPGDPASQPGVPAPGSPATGADSPATPAPGPTPGDPTDPTDPSGEVRPSGSDQ
jgi:cell division protease FtsH